MDWYALKVEDLKKQSFPRTNSGSVKFKIQFDPDDVVSGYAEMDVSRYDDCDGALAWLRWLREFEHLRELKDWGNRPNVCHNALKILLTGETRVEYLTLVGDQLKITNEMIDNALFQITKTSVFYGDDPSLSLRHLLETMVKPKQMPVMDFHLAFKELLSFMPIVARGGTSPIAKPSYSSQDIYELFANSLPDRWTTEFKRTGRPQTVKHLLQYCQVMEGTEARKKAFKQKF